MVGNWIGEEKRFEDYDSSGGSERDFRLSCVLVCVRFLEREKAEEGDRGLLLLRGRVGNRIFILYFIISPTLNMVKKWQHFF